MTQEEMATVMSTVFNECHMLRAAGQAEYAGKGSDAFNNFNKLAADLGISRELVLMVYAKKHYDGIIHFIRGHKSQREDVRGRINDLIVYMCLLRGMIEEQETPALESILAHSAEEFNRAPGAFKMEER